MNRESSPTLEKRSSNATVGDGTTSWLSIRKRIFLLTFERDSLFSYLLCCWEGQAGARREGEKIPTYQASCEMRKKEKRFITIET